MLLSLFSLVATVHVAAQPGTGTWKNTTLDNENVTGSETSLAIDSHDYPHISYFESGSPGNDKLRYAWQDAGGWHNTTVISSGVAGEQTSLALDGNGYAHISYVSTSNYKTLMYAWQDAAGWHNTTIDSAGDE